MHTFHLQIYSKRERAYICNSLVQLTDLTRPNYQKPLPREPYRETPRSSELPKEFQQSVSDQLSSLVEDIRNASIKLSCFAEEETYDDLSTSISFCVINPWQ